MTKLTLPEEMASQAAGSAVDTYIIRLTVALNEKIKIPMGDQIRASSAAIDAATVAEKQPGADALSVYDAAFNAAFISLTARFDPTAEEMLAYERSIGQ